MADGIAYSIRFPKAAASDASDVSVPRAAVAASSPPPTPSAGRLVASSCAALGGNGDDVSVGDGAELGATAAASALWSVPLPAASGNVWQRGVIVTPASLSLHRSVRGAALSTTAGVPVVVYAGGQ